MRLRKLSLKDKAIFDKYLVQEAHGLSVYAFANIYIWKVLFDIEWAVIEDNLCVFLKDRMGCFLYLAPLGAKKNPEVAAQVFEIMDGYNRNTEISRIENIEEAGLSFYRGLGYACKKKSVDYLCNRDDLVNLNGDAFKSKRACINFFKKNYSFEYIPYVARHKKECLRLYGVWAAERASRNPDPVYQGMLEDGAKCLKLALTHYSDLGLSGRIVKVDHKIRAFTFGYPLNPRTFCVLYEVADLSCKGLAQFVFREFCDDAQKYTCINVMDDSGLENLRRVKLSYKPARLIPAYTATRRK